MDICDVGIGPLHTQYYELLRVDQWRHCPGEFVDVDLVSVEQDICATTCDGTDLDAVTFVPNSFVDQNLSL